MMILLGYDDELGRDEASLLKLKALFVAPLIDACGGKNKLDCANNADGSSFNASS